jgi:hypothetical protein
MRMNKFFVVFLFGAVSLSGCVTLKRVNDFSTAAAGSLQNFEKINTSATEIYVSRVTEHRYRDYSESTLTLGVDTPQSIEGFALTLGQARRVDSLLAKEYHALNGYFMGLAKLSADSIGNYTVDTVTTSLAGGSLLDTSKITPATISTVSAVAVKVGAFVSAEYRIHRIKEYISSLKDTVQLVIDDLRDRLATLHIFLERQQSLLKDHVYEPLLKQSQTPWERKSVIDQYQAVMSELRHEQRQLDTYAYCLGIISEGYQYIRDHVNDLRGKEVKTALAKYASRLQDGHSEFSKIKILNK